MSVFMCGGVDVWMDGRVYALPETQVGQQSRLVLCMCIRVSVGICMSPLRPSIAPPVLLKSNNTIQYDTIQYNTTPHNAHNRWCCSRRSPSRKNSSSNAVRLGGLGAGWAGWAGWVGWAASVCGCVCVCVTDDGWSTNSINIMDG